MAEARAETDEIPRSEPKAPKRRDGSLASAFGPWARRVRFRLAARWMAGGATVGMLLGLGAAAAAWWLRHGRLRPLAALAAVVGAAIGAWLARGRRWSDLDVALFLDKKLESREAIATAIDLGDGGGKATALVRRDALAALAKPRPKGLGPRVWRPWHASFVAATGMLAWICLLALPPAPPAPPSPPGLDKVALEDLKGLDKVIALSELEARDPAQRERLKAIAEHAKQLKEKLKEGMARREAQAELGKLREEVAAERQRLGTGEERRGLEAALSQLAKNPKLDEAQRALGDRDLTSFDEDMEKLANQLEEQDREKAKQALEEAAEAARKEGAESVAKSLEEQKKLLEERGKRAQAMKELAKAFGDGLSPEAKKALEHMKNGGSRRDQQKLGKELAKALDGLSDADRKKLAEKLKEAAKNLDPDGSQAMPMTKEQLEDMQKKLSTPEGQKELAEKLKEWANQPPQSGESQRDQKLGDAEKGLGEGEQQLEQPMPMPTPGPGKDGKDGSGKDGKDGKDGSGKDGKDGKDGSGKDGSGKDGDGSGDGKDGSGKDGGDSGSDSGDGDGDGGISRGGGPGKHDGKTGKVDGDSVRARARGKLNPGAPNPGTVLGRTPGQPGETAKTGGAGRLGEVGPSEVSGMERSEIPKEYREQVGRYFPAN